MAKGFKAGGGGGGNPLNFKVVGNPKPENPKENTIWVDTDKAIPEWMFRSDEPAGMRAEKKSVGSVVKMNDASEAGLTALTLYGKTTQFVTTGKNIVDVFNESMSVMRDGNLASSYPNIVNEDGSLTINISGSLSYSYGQGFAKSLSVGQTVTISYFVDSIGNGTGLRLRIFDTNNYSSPKVSKDTTSTGKVTHTFTADADSVYMFGWFVLSGTAPCGGKIHDLQLEFGSVATAYEPYTGGIPSPNPDYPQALETPGADGSLDVQVSNSNLIPFPYSNKDGVTTNGLTFNIQPDGSVVVNGKATAEAFFSITSANAKTLYLPKGKYTFSGVSSGSYGGSLRPQLWVRNTDSTIKFAVYAEGKTVEITEPGYFAVSIDIVKNNTLNNFVVKPMINVGETALPFESPIERQTLTASTPNGLPGIPVSSGGNYIDENGQMWICDEVDFARGKYVQRVRKSVFDGSEDEDWLGVSSAQASKYRKRLVLTDKLIFTSDQIEPMLCDRYSITKSGITGDTYNCITSFAGTANQSRVHFYDEAMPGADDTEWRAYLAEHPFTLIYPLATPIETSLTAEEIAQYSALHTNAPNTTIYNDEGADMKVGYVSDPKDGFVWIKTGTSSPTEFNALKKNGISVCPLAAKQCVDGKMVDKTAQIYQGGEWHDWTTYIYNLGWDAASGLNTASGGGAPNISVGTSGGYLTLSRPTTWNSWAKAVTPETYDLTGVGTIYCETGSMASWEGSPIRFGVAKPGDSTPTAAVSLTESNTVYSLDVSALSGEYVVGFFGYNGDQSQDWRWYESSQIKAFWY